MKMLLLLRCIILCCHFPSRLSLSSKVKGVLLGRCTSLYPPLCCHLQALLTSPAIFWVVACLPRGAVFSEFMFNRFREIVNVLLVVIFSCLTGAAVSQLNCCCRKKHRNKPITVWTLYADAFTSSDLTVILVVYDALLVLITDYIHKEKAWWCLTPGEWAVAWLTSC